MTCVLNKQKKPGVLKFIGETKFSSGVWCGIALREACGKNDGSVAGVRYFECDERHGIFVNPNSVFPVKTEDEQKPLQVTSPVRRDEESSANEQELETSDSNFEEGRPRSKSDAVITEKKEGSNVFTNSPFKCNIRNTKSSSLTKLNNVTYVCHSPVFNDSKDLCEATHSTPFLSSHATSREVCDGQKNEDMPVSIATSTLHHHTDLSPKFEVKQSIKLGSINTARFPAPAGLGKDQDSNLNKTFLLRTENRSVEREGEQVHKTSETRTDSNERSANNNDREKQEDIISLANQDNTNAVSTNESDGENGRRRSASKSSWSSMESLSSVGSVKSNKERSRLGGTKTPRKLPCPSECSKSKLVKISAEKKPKVLDREAATTALGKLVSKSARKPVANDALAKKNRTKSTSVVAPRSVLATPSVSRSVLKTKSKSVSSDVRDGQPLSRSRLNSSKFATPLACKISAPPSSRLTSTPICKKPTGLEKKSKLSNASVSNRTSSISSLTRNDENEQKSISRENSNVENKVSSLQVKNKQSSSIMSAKKEKESKADNSRSRNRSTTSTKSLSAKSRTLSTSAALKYESKAVSARGRNLSTSCTTKEEIKPSVGKLRNMSTSRAERGITKTSGE